MNATEIDASLKKSQHQQQQRNKRSLNPHQSAGIGGSNDAGGNNNITMANLQTFSAQLSAQKAYEKQLAQTSTTHKQQQRDRHQQLNNSALLATTVPTSTVKVLL